MSSELHQQSAAKRSGSDNGFGSRFISPWGEEVGVRRFLAERSGTRCEYYGSGKVALRDGLDILEANIDSYRTSVLLPAYVPSALLEPIKEAGFTPRLYRITQELRPDLADVESLIDQETLALVSINYFGFPQPSHDALTGIAADYDVPLIEDNAHSSLSMTASGTLLGTRGDLGFTSFRKTMPVPNGAALFIWRDEFLSGPYPRGGIHRGFTAHDGRFILHKLVELVSKNRVVRGSPRTGESNHLGEGRDLFGRDPGTVYLEASQPMSRLSALVLDRLRPAAIVEVKRRNYHNRHRFVATLDGSRAVFGHLPRGTCPQAFPIIVEDTEELAASIEVAADSLPRWPPLPYEVVMNDRFETSQYLADHLVPLSI